MRGVVLEGIEDVACRDVPDAVIEEASDAVIRVTAAGLCGSDLHPYLGREAAATGVVQGHETVGEIVATGTDVTGFNVGDRVLVPFTTSCGACLPCRTGLSSRCVRSRLFGWGPPAAPGEALHGGQAELLRVPDADGTLVRVPASLTDLDAVLLADNLPTAWYAATRAGIRGGTEVAVVGLGAVGLCAVTAAFALGAGSVVGVDPVAERRDLAERLGATAVHPEAVADRQVDASIEAAGPPAAQRLAGSLVRAGGTCAVVAVQTETTTGFDAVDAYDRNLTIRFGRAPVRSVLDVVLPRVVAGQVHLPTDMLITESGLALSDAPAVYARFAAREAGVVKLVFAP